MSDATSPVGPKRDRLDPPPAANETRMLDGSRGHRLWSGIWHPVPSDLPDRGTVVLAHGLSEHAGRYGHIITALTGHGYTVVALDHRGHGRSEGVRFRIARFDDFVADLDLAVTLAREVAARRSERPRPPFLFGHSMGGLIATRYVLGLPDQAALAGLILSSPALQLTTDLSGPALWATGLLARVAPTLPVRRSDGGLSSDPEIGRRWAADPLVNHGPTSIQMAHQIAAAARDARARLDRITLPLLLFYGEADTVVDPAGSRTLAECAGSADLTARPWPELLHETFNEPNGDEVIAEMVAWLDDRTGRDPEAAV
jgi:acylglycerol lipase